jgi:uncharacterized membrane protein YdbT with pleckstrin-like domain
MKNLRIIARILDSILLLLIIMFFIGEGSPDIKQLTTIELILLAAVLAMILGEIIAWKWEGAGGVCILGGVTLFILTNALTTHQVWPGWVFALVGVSGILFIITWIGSKYQLTNR